MSDRLYLNECFYSLDGEGPRTGYPSVFIRLAGCNLRCSYCDTCYALEEDDGIEVSIQDVLDEVKRYDCGNITLTGGEPLLQEGAFELLKALDGYDIVVETNGAVDITDALPYASMCMDWKCPSSNMERLMLESNLNKLRPIDCLKMVVEASDLPYVKKFLDEHTLLCPVYLSPVFGKVSLPVLAQFVKEYRGDNVLRMQVQLHKIIWNPDQRGV